ncbi:thiol reductase thioredoxin [Spirochaetia bacterium]|nr:thiol reductase thioredoxin [Spirochaetia bacterium]
MKQFLFFTGTYCGPCKAIKPAIRELQEIYGDRVEFLEVDQDEQEDMFTQYHITMTPTFIFLEDNQEYERRNGNIGRYELEKIFRRFCDDD